MKSYKSKAILLLSTIIIITSSCKKDYTCTCITKVTGYGIDETSTSTTTLADMKEKDAKSNCNALESNFNSFGFTSSTTCVLE